MLLALQKLSSNLGQFKPTPGPDQLGRRALTLSQNQDRANVKGPEIFLMGGVVFQWRCYQPVRQPSVLLVEMLFFATVRTLEAYGVM